MDVGTVAFALKLHRQLGDGHRPRTEERSGVAPIIDEGDGAQGVGVTKERRDAGYVHALAVEGFEGRVRLRQRAQDEVVHPPRLRRSFSPFRISSAARPDAERTQPRQTPHQPGQSRRPRRGSSSQVETLQIREIRRRGRNRGIRPERKRRRIGQSVEQHVPRRRYDGRIVGEIDIFRPRRSSAPQSRQSGDETSQVAIGQAGVRYVQSRD
mmetsp:Transcript_30690/g.91869  ORF Transcript_30690/g.91869 Transcript_30690/m.91869 type:complete len:211 (-) Transcript_30690:1509-2141(-)